MKPSWGLGTVVTLVRRDYLIARSYKLTFILDLFFGIANLLIIFYVSRTIATTAVDLGAAPSYFAFALVGAAIAVVTSAAGVGMARKIREEQLTGTLEALMAQPIQSIELAVGTAGFPFLFAIVRAAVYLMVPAIAMGVDVSDANWWGVASLLIASGTSLGVLGIALGSVTLLVKRGDVLVGIGIFALEFIGGAFFPISVLPAFVQDAAQLTPTRSIFDGLRAALFNGTGWAGDLIFLSIFTLASAPLAAAVFHWALNVARRRGDLADY